MAADFKRIIMSGKKEFLNTLRHDFQMDELNRSELPANPIRQFGQWFDEGVANKVIEVNAMTISTVAADGMPSARIVLLRSFNDAGFVFYTNYNSHKGRELLANPKVCLSFFWPQLERQVRISGTAAKQSEADSDAYFNLRPRGSRVGAWASPQSQVISGREFLEQEAEKVEARFASGEVTRPPHWGGYAVQPTAIEFWQGRPSRLHDRFRYDIQADGSWTIDRLAP